MESKGQGLRDRQGTSGEGPEVTDNKGRFRMNAVGMKGSYYKRANAA